MHVRAYRESDHDAVVRLWCEVFPDAPKRNDPARNIAMKLNVQRDLFLVAERQGEIVGTAMAGFDGHRGWVYYVAVSPEARRRGVGTALMREVEKRLVTMGCPKLNLQVRGTNVEVVSFYESLGFAVEDNISMGRQLEGSE
ncbi:MAG: GNAT family acetyltransferase [Candidatus Eisenbacteria bacterium]|nr:GNAT family acetyltransferase [Candidatus Eisenbacteria bacterium]